MKNTNIDLALQHIGIETLTPMQVESLSMYPQCREMVLLSPTGTGKTLAYLLPLMQTLDIESDDVQAVVIVPSRELALQIDGVIRRMACGVRSVSCYGGRPAMEEHRTLKGVLPHIVVATPGRLNDHLQKRNIEVSGIRSIVIDEFDKCLEFGFLDEMNEVISQLPLVQRRFLTSATDNDRIPQFVGSNFTRLDYLDEAPDVKERISQYVVHSPIKDKLETLACLLRCQGQKSSIVFLNYRDAVERVYKFLRSEGFHVEMFHGGMDQQMREKSLYKFSNATSNVMVSTDLSARGLDIEHVDNIIHYHLPLNEDAFTHRNGRTARWDAEGSSYIILNEDESLMDYIEDEPTEFFIPKSLPPIQPSRWTTIYIGKGKKDKISKMDILGFLCKIGGLKSADVGRIDVKDHYAFVAVNRKMAHGVLAAIKGQKIKGVKTIFQEAR